MPGRARKEIFAPNESGIYHCFSRCVRQNFLMESAEAESMVLKRTPDRDGEWVEFRGKKGLRYRRFRRRGWLAGRLVVLAAIMAIDVITYTVMGNHLHVIIRNRPDIAGKLTDREVAKRWKSLNSKSFELREVTEEEIDEYVKDPEKIAQWRKNLSDISWFMRMLKEPVSIAANRRDGKHGHFWEARFRSQRLLDESALLACMVYVDLNPIRAAMAKTPEESSFTSIADRIRDLKERVRAAAAVAAAVFRECGTAGRDTASSAGDAASPAEPVRAANAPSPDSLSLAGVGTLAGATPVVPEVATSNAASSDGTAGLRSSSVQSPCEPMVADCGTEPQPAAEGGVDVKSAIAAAFAAPHAGWLNPIDERGDGYAGVAAGRRASDSGVLPISLETYVQIVDWTGRQLRADKRGSIPNDLAPILDRLGLRTEAWLETIENFGKWFGVMVGKAAAMDAKAAQSGVRSWGGMKYCRRAFT